MKETNFFKNAEFVSGGIYDNIKIFENTLDAIKLSINKRVNLYLKLNVTKDGVIIVYNDDDLSRIHSLKDKIEDVTYDELSYLSFYHIPSLEEILKIIKGKVDVILVCKKKIKNIFEILDDYKGRFAILSSNPSFINYINKNRPNFIVGEIITKSFKFSIKSMFNKIDFKSYNIKYFDYSKLKKMKSDNQPIIGYVINNKTNYKTYKDYFDSIIIDNYINLKCDK